MPIHFHTVTRTADILRAAGIRIVAMSKIQIDADEHEAIALGLLSRRSTRDGDVSIITGDHEDLGHVTLRREDGVFTVEAEETSFVRPFGTPIRRQ